MLFFLVTSVQWTSYLSLALIFAVILLITILFDLNHWVWAPRRIRKYLRRQPLKDIQRLGGGFRVVNEEYLSGSYKGYPVNIGYSWFGKLKLYRPCVFMEVFFRPAVQSQSHHARLDADPALKVRVRRRKLKWSAGSVYYESGYYFTMPGIDSLVRDLDVLIQEARRRNLQPASEAELPDSYTNAPWLSITYFFIRRLR